MLTHDKVCPNDKSNELSSEWSGLIIVLDVQHSNVAQTLISPSPADTLSR